MNNTRKEVIFYNAEAVLKYNVDQNGLYLNDMFGTNGYTSPYMGIHVPNETLKSYLSHINIHVEFYKNMQTDNRISSLASRGILPSNILHAKNRHLDLGSYKDQRDAAWIAQCFLYSEDAYEMQVKFIIEKYTTEKDTYVIIDEILREFEIEKPTWEYPELIGSLYNPDAVEYKFTKLQKEEAKKELEAHKVEVEKAKTLEENRKRYLDKWLKAGYTEDTFNTESIKLIISGKIK